MARETENPDTAGKDMDMSDVAMWCTEEGCGRPAKRGERKCPKHLDS